MDLNLSSMLMWYRMQSTTTLWISLARSTKNNNIKVWKFLFDALGVMDPLDVAKKVIFCADASVHIKVHFSEYNFFPEWFHDAKSKSSMMKTLHFIKNHILARLILIFIPCCKCAVGKKTVLTQPKITRRKSAYQRNNISEPLM